MPMHQKDFKPARSLCGLHKLWPTLVTNLVTVSVVPAKLSYEYLIR